MLQSAFQQQFHTQLGLSQHKHDSSNTNHQACSPPETYPVMFFSPGFHEGSTRVPRGSARFCMLLGISPEPIFEGDWLCKMCLALVLGQAGRLQCAQSVRVDTRRALWARTMINCIHSVKCLCCEVKCKKCAFGLVGGCGSEGMQTFYLLWPTEGLS